MVPPDAGASQVIGVEFNPTDLAASGLRPHRREKGSHTRLTPFNLQ
jgi:hypothetical protein